jgi:hypothetical protein
MEFNPFGSLSQFSKTWLQKDLKDIFPHEAVVEGMVKDKDSKFGVITLEDFGDKLETRMRELERDNSDLREKVKMLEEEMSLLKRR